MLDNIRIVLVNTSHPGNIGAAARAMKNMGLSKLVLVDPKDHPAFEKIDPQLITGIISELGIFMKKSFIEEIRRAYPFMFKK